MAETQPNPSPQDTAPKGARSIRKRRVYMLHDPTSMKAVGKFVSNAPRSAAMKAASRGFKDIRLRETGTRVIHAYKGDIVPINPPKVVQRGQSTVAFSKKSVVKFEGKTSWKGEDPPEEEANVAENPRAPLP